MVDVERVLIVGGGIAGLSLAVALERRGVCPELVERSPQWPETGAGIALHANAGRVLRGLGVGEAVQASAAHLPRWRFLDQDGATLCCTDLAELWGEVGPCLGISRRRLHGVLRAAAPRTRARLGVTASALEQTGTGVAVRFSDGTESDYELVVGADGIRSTVRRAVAGTVAPSYVDVMSWRSIVAGPPGGSSDLRIYLGEGCFFGLVPVEDGQTYGFGAVVGPSLDDPTAGRLDRLRKRFAGFAEPVRSYLAGIAADEQVHPAPIESIELDRWHVGRVVLIGDAAHAMPPHMGEGGAMAMEDAAVLAEILDEADTVPDGLAAFESRRRPRVTIVQEHSRAAARAWALPPAARDTVLRERGDQMLRDRYRPLIEIP